MNATTILAGLALVCSAAACSAGTGSPIPVPSGKQEPPGPSTEPGGSSHEPGTTGPEPTSGGPESGGAAGGSTSPTACPACDQTYGCTGGDAGTINLSLVSSGGVCSVSGSAGSVFSCSGTLTFSATTGSITVSWTSVPGGGFSFGQIVCTPETLPAGAPGASNGQG